MALKKSLMPKSAGIDGDKYVEKKHGPTEVTQEISIDLIALHEENDYRRFECDDASIRILADAIKNQGFVGSLTVCERSGGLGMDLRPAVGTKYVLLAGERRLRAIRMLMAENDDMKVRYSKVPCVVKSGFSNDEAIRHAQEMVILDGNNINTRGGLSGLPDDEFAVRVTNRYIENLMLGHGMSRKDATHQIKVISGQERTVSRNVRLWEKLTPELFDMVVGSGSGVRKLDADSMTAIPKDEQQLFVDAYATVHAARDVLGARFDEIIQQLTANILEISLKTEKSEREADYATLHAAVKEKVQAELAAVAAAEREQQRKLEELEQANRTIEALKAAGAELDAEAIHRRKTAEAVKASRDSKKRRLLEKDRKTYYGYIKRAMSSLESLRQINGVELTLRELENTREDNESIAEALNQIIAQAKALLQAVEEQSES